MCRDVCRLNTLYHFGSWIRESRTGAMVDDPPRGNLLII